MSCRRTRLSKIATLAFLSFLCLALQPNLKLSAAAGPSLRMQRLPRQTFWAWERPEDLHAIDPKTTAVAYLDQTILIGPEVISEARHQPLAYPSDATRIAVVRIEVLPGMKFDAAAERQVVELLLRSAVKPGISVLQVDFDATRSQRSFYGDVLRDLRRQIPVNLPLSITALASWCNYDDWITGLPVDEAVPMFFRMEPNRSRVRANGTQFRINEPLCMGSVGISTHEAWPEDMAGKRVYVFADRGWREDLSLLTDRKLP
jgi:hypothetical protein